MRNKTWTLAKVMLKSGGGIDLGFNRHKKWSWIIPAALFILFIPLTLIAYLEMVGFVYQSLAVIGQEGVILSWGLALSSLIIFIFGIFHVVSSFYFANDVENYLPLPVMPRQIVGAKFLVAVLYEYIMVGIVYLPILFYYGIQQREGILFYLYGLIIAVFVPIMPLVLATLLVMLIMRVVNLGRYRELLKIIGGLLSFVLAMTVSFSMQRFDSITPDMLERLLLEGNNSLTLLQSRLFPTVHWAVKSLLNYEIAQGLTNLLVFVGLSCAAFAVLMFSAELVYFKGVIGISEAGSSRRGVKTEHLGRLVRTRSPIISYLLMEMRLLVRTPVYFLNCVVVNFIWPVFFILPVIVNDDGLTELIGQIAVYVQDPDILGLVFGVFLAVIAFFGGSNGIAATAISREGQNLYVKHYLPISYRHQLIAKVLTGVVLSYAGLLLMIIPLAVILKVPVYFTILVMVISLLPLILTNMTGLMLDIVNPKLNWDSEQKAVKQNMNVMYNALVSAGIGVLLTALTFILRPNLLAAAVVLPGVLLLGCAGMYYLLKTFGTTRFRELEG